MLQFFLKLSAQCGSIIGIVYFFVFDREKWKDSLDVQSSEYSPLRFRQLTLVLRTTTREKVR